LNIPANLLLISFQRYRCCPYNEQPNNNIVSREIGRMSL
jgi:hypothetical protein